MRTPAWRLAESLRQRAYDLMYALQTEPSEAVGRARVGELRAMLTLALEYGTVGAEEATRLLEQVERARPHLFREPPNDIFSRLAAWLREHFGRLAQPRTVAE
jgi:hypothetical protein